MTVDKSELIAQIVAKEGLSGEALLKRKSELEKMERFLLEQELSNGLAGTSSMNQFGWKIEKQAQPQFPYAPQAAPPKPEVKYNQSEQIAMIFLGNMTKSAQSTVEEREKEAGPLSWCVNTWEEIIDDELAKSNVNKNISETKKDIAQLEKAAMGENTKFNFVTRNNVPITFAETFKIQRGVEFSESNIKDCQAQSEVFAGVKTAKTMVDNLKSKLNYYTTGTVSASMDNTGASKTIYDIFKLSGISHSTYMNQALETISEKYKNHPDIKKYGGEFQFAQEGGKIKNPPTILRRAGNGTLQPITTEQTRIIAKELTLNLNKAYASTLNCEIKEGSTSEEIEELAQVKFNEYKSKYEASFAKAYGKKDLKALAENYVQNQEKKVANIELGINVLSLATMFVGSGVLVKGGQLTLKGALAAKNSVSLANTAKSIGAVDKAKSLVKGTTTATKIAQKASPFIAANMVARPAYLAEQIFSQNGMSQDEWTQWGEGAILNAGFMAAGLGSAKLAEGAASWYKTKGLVNILKSSGKSADEIAALVKSNPVRFPSDVVQKFASLDKVAKGLQVTTEVALDLSSSYALSKGISGQNLTSQDWIMSVGFALSGGVLQKQFAPLSKEAKIKFLQDNFKEINLSKEDASMVLKAMDDISAGKKSSPIKPTKPKVIEYPEVYAEATRLHEAMAAAESEIVADVKSYGLDNKGEMSHRPKSVQSLYDKMAEDFVQNKDMASALKSVRDGIGTRTELDAFNLKDYPELIKLHKTNPEAAYQKAAQLQSQAYLDKIKNVIEAQAQDPQKMKALSISNYKGKDGIAYLSETQIEDLRAFAASKGITNFKAKTGIRGSGYTALQMNFKHSNGVTSEWQLRGNLVNKFAECEHVPYDLRTGKDISGGNPELAKLYEPFKKIMEDMPESDYKLYEEYLTDYYKNLRIEELGFEAKYPDLPPKLDSKLSAKGLEDLHEAAEAIKKAQKAKTANSTADPPK